VLQAGHQVFLGTVPLDPVAVATEQLQFFPMVCSPLRLGDDVVDFQDAEGEFTSAAIATTFLLAKEHMFVLAIGGGGIHIGGLGYVSAGCNQVPVKQAPHGLLETHIDQFHRL